MTLSAEEICKLKELAYKSFRNGSRNYGTIELNFGNVIISFFVADENAITISRVELEQSFLAWMWNSNATLISLMEDGPWWDTVRYNIRIVEIDLERETEKLKKEESKRIEKLRKNYK